MNILTIPFRNIRRKPAKTLMLLLVFTLGVVSIVSLVSFSRVVRHSLEQKLWAFGPNILVFPKTEQLRLSYGGMSAGNVTMDVRFLDEAAVLAGIDAIPNRANVRAVSPKLVSMAKIGLPNAASRQRTDAPSETSVGVVGVHPAWFSLPAMCAAAHLHAARGGRLIHVFLHSSDLLPGCTPAVPTERAARRMLDRLARFLRWLHRRHAVAGATLASAAMDSPFPAPRPFC